MWIIFGITFAILLCGSEIMARSNGVIPSFIDTLELWQYVRDGVASGEESKNQVLVLGSSRARLGFVPDVFRKETSCPVVMLALDGVSGWPLLKDFAENTDFRGTIICSFRADSYSENDGGAAEQASKNYYSNYTNMGKYERILNRKIEGIMQGNLAIMHVRPNDLHRVIFSKEEAMAVNYLVVEADRHAKAYYRTRLTKENMSKAIGVRLSRLDLLYAKKPQPYQVWLERMQDIRKWVKLIQDRGGHVVLLRYPTTGEYWRRDNEVYPREKYWNRLADLTNATTIHFKDLPDIANVECPDASHLNYDDAEKFTKMVADELIKKKIIIPQKK
jgi:hypothetical protein